MKCPLSYTHVRNMVFLYPREMIPNPSNCRKKFKKILAVLVNSNKIKAEDFDNILEQYSNLWTGFQSLGVIFHLSTQMFKEFFL